MKTPFTNLNIIYKFYIVKFLIPFYIYLTTAFALYVTTQRIR
jgi:hypothetical protein